MRMISVLRGRDHLVCVDDLRDLHDLHVPDRMAST